MTRVSHTQEFKMTRGQQERYFDGKEMIRTIFPDYTRDQREFLASGITAEEWKKIIGNSD